MTAYGRLTVGKSRHDAGTGDFGCRGEHHRRDGRRHTSDVHRRHVRREVHDLRRSTHPWRAESAVPGWTGRANRSVRRDDARARRARCRRIQDATLVGDTIRLEIEVSEKRRSSSGRRGFISFAWTCRNQRDEIVLTARATLAFRTAEG